MFDIRPGERLRTWAMFFYLLFVLFAYYILKPVSRAMFLNRFDIDRLPGLYILIAVFGGALAYLYAKLAAKTSLRSAVFWTMTASLACLVAMWWLIRMRLPWMIYVLNIWVSLFAIVLVSQGWLVASNLFNERQAKRVYAFLAMGMVLGAAFGGEFTNRTAALVGTKNLLLASAGMVVLAYAAFRAAILKSAEALARAPAAQAGEADFRFRDMARDILRTRHLMVIAGLMFITYLVDVFVDYQFQSVAQASYHGDRLTAFLGQFYGLYLNAAELVLQLLLTSAVVGWFGVGATLQILPAVVGLASAGTIAAPRVATAGAVRLAEASTRYTLNRTGMELLYMPLPKELRNRIKAFIDIFMDRFSRGVGGVLLVLLTTTTLDLGVRGIAILTAGLSIPWVLLANMARKEYVATVRRRFQPLALEQERVRIAGGDAAAIRLAEATALGTNSRQAAYALTLLAETPGYDVRPLLRQAALGGARPAPVRSRIYEIASALRYEGVLEQAMAEIRTAQADNAADLAPAAIPYALAVTPDPSRLAAELLDAGNTRLAAGVIASLREIDGFQMARDWSDRMAESEDPERRALAAAAIGVRSSGNAQTLRRLLVDRDPRAASVACRAAGDLRDRACLPGLLAALGEPGLRGEAVAALAAFGPAVCGELAEALLSESAPLPVRRQIPRALGKIPDQRSADVLLAAAGHPDLAIRAAALRAMNRLRRNAPRLKFDGVFVTRRIMAEARYYFELNAALEPLRGRADGGRATDLLARTIEERLRNTLERLFRLLGLRYPPKDMRSAYVAVSRRGESAIAAMEFLDNVLDRNLRRILLPLLDAPEHVGQHGREIFGVEARNAEEAIRGLIHSRDTWLAACSVAAAAELNLRGLSIDIALAAKGSASEVSEVARSAGLALAA